MRRHEPLSLNEIIQRMIDDTGLRPSYEQHSVEALWPGVVGRSIAQYTRQVWFSMADGVLHVEIRSAALKEELGYLKEALIKHLNAAYGSKIVKSIVIH